MPLACGRRPRLTLKDTILTSGLLRKLARMFVPFVSRDLEPVMQFVPQKQNVVNTSSIPSVLKNGYVFTVTNRYSSHFETISLFKFTSSFKEVMLARFAKLISLKPDAGAAKM